MRWPLCPLPVSMIGKQVFLCFRLRDNFVGFYHVKPTVNYMFNEKCIRSTNRNKWSMSLFFYVCERIWKRHMTCRTHLLSFHGNRPSRNTNNSQEAFPDKQGKKSFVFLCICCFGDFPARYFFQSLSNYSSASPEQKLFQFHNKRKFRTKFILLRVVIAIGLLVCIAWKLRSKSKEDNIYFMLRRK